MARPLRPYVHALDDLLSGRNSPSKYQSLVIEQYCYADAGVDWSKEWGSQVDDALEQLHGDAEVFGFDHGEDPPFTLERFLASARRILQVLRDAEGRATQQP